MITPPRIPPIVSAATPNVPLIHPTLAGGQSQAAIGRRVQQKGIGQLDELRFGKAEDEQKTG
jgi:hypothetical protein